VEKQWKRVRRFGPKPAWKHTEVSSCRGYNGRRCPTAVLRSDEPAQGWGVDWTTAPPCHTL